MTVEDVAGQHYQLPKCQPPRSDLPHYHRRQFIAKDLRLTDRGAAGHVHVGRRLLFIAEASAFANINQRGSILPRAARSKHVLGKQY